MAQQTPPYALQAASHSAALFREAVSSLLWQPGVVDGASYVVAQQSTPNMTVQVAAGWAWVDGTQVANASGQNFSTQASYFGLNDASVTLTIAASNATLARIDVVYLAVADAQYSGATNNITLAVQTGTAASSPTVPALPNNAISLAQVRVNATVTTILNSNITNANTTTGTVPPGVAVVAGTPIPFQSTGRPTGTRLGALGYEYDTSKLMLNGASGWTPYGAGIWSATSGARPPSPTTGQIIYETDTADTRVWNGSNWVPIGAISCTSTTRPATPVAGTLIYETDTTRVSVWTGAAWRTVGQTADTGWTNATLANGWVNFGSSYPPARYRKLSTGQVEIQGLIKSGTTGVAAFTLPAGYRPGTPVATQLIFPAISSNGSPVTSELRVDGNGQVQPFFGSGVNYYSLSAIFLAEQ